VRELRFQPISENGLLGRRSDFVKPDRIVSSGVNPQKGVVPPVCELDLDVVVTSGAPGSARLEDCVRALAGAVNAFQQKVPAFVPRYSRGVAFFAEGFHFPRPGILQLTTNTQERWVKLLPR
jgi:hypothetical protein